MVKPKNVFYKNTTSFMAKGSWFKMTDRTTIPQKSVYLEPAYWAWKISWPKGGGLCRTGFDTEEDAWADIKQTLPEEDK